MSEVRKRLSPNDLGETGSHQAGILVPKNEKILSFFPQLVSTTKNPRIALVVRELGDGRPWSFNFIYYNGKLFGGTRNEYRLTGMTQYLRMSGASASDEVVFTKDVNGSYVIDIARARSVADDPDILVLSGGWKVINY